MLIQAAVAWLGVSLYRGVYVVSRMYCRCKNLRFDTLSRSDVAPDAKDTAIENIAVGVERCRYGGGRRSRRRRGNKVIGRVS